MFDYQFFICKFGLGIIKNYIIMYNQLLEGISLFVRTLTAQMMLFGRGASYAIKN